MPKGYTLRSASDLAASARKGAAECSALAARAQKAGLQVKRATSGVAEASCDDLGSCDVAPAAMQPGAASEEGGLDQGELLRQADALIQDLDSLRAEYIGVPDEPGDDDDDLRSELVENAEGAAVRARGSVQAAAVAYVKGELTRAEMVAQVYAKLGVSPQTIAAAQTCAPAARAGRARSVAASRMAYLRRMR